MIKWFKKLRRIVASYDEDILSIKRTTNDAVARSQEAVQVIKDRTDIHADIHYKSNSQVIVCGRYRNKDYVQVYNIRHDDLAGLIDKLRHMEKYGHMARVDAPPDIKAVFDHEFHR